MPYAIFLDVLGTSTEMTALPDDHEFRSDSLSPRTRFREGLNWAARKAETSLLYCAAFSDCGYIIVESPLECLHVARFAMSWFKGDVPVRGGIGYGNFGHDGSNHHWDGKTIFTEASFYGSSLVRAHRAESCGHKGMRLFVHKSASSSLSAVNDGVQVYPEDTQELDDDYIPLAPVPATVVAIPNSLVEDVSHELCCVGHDSINEWVERVGWLEKKNKPNKEAYIHYVETRKALYRFKELRDSANRVRAGI